jgi:hypothetical protein
MSKHAFLPNFFIIGAAKAGTTTLYNTLNQHPQVYFPFQKEPSFFCDDEYYNKGVDWYINTFYATSSLKNARGDATPRYLYWGQKVVPRIKFLYGNHLPCIIVIFRDPVALVHSYYWQSVRDGKESLSLREALALEETRVAQNYPSLQHRGRTTHLYSRIGNYASQLQPYIQTFPRKNFLFLLTEDLKDYPKLISKLENFLGLEHAESIKPVFSNPAQLPRSRGIHQWLVQTSRLKDFAKKFLPLSLRHRLKISAINLNLKPMNIPPLDPEVASRLRKHYANDVQKLEGIIQRDLSAWYMDG